MSSKIEYPKVCARCGINFTAKKLSTQYCSHRCSSLAYKEKLKEQRVELAKTEVKNRNKPPILREKLDDPQRNKASPVNRDYLSVRETSYQMGVCRATINNYCKDGKLKCIKINRRIYIRRSDIEALFDNAPPYTVTPRSTTVKTSQQTQETRTLPMSDCVTAADAAKLYGVTTSAIHRKANSHNVPWVIYNKTRHYQAEELAKIYPFKEEYPHLSEWYTTEEIVEQFKMSKTAIYSLVSKFHIPRKKENSGCIYYSKLHIDEILEKRIGDKSITEWYTSDQIYQKYGLGATYISNFVHVNKIPRRRDNNKSQYSAKDFDRAIEKRNPPSVYLLIKDAAIYFSTTPTQVHNLIRQHQLPTRTENREMRVQKVALDNIINPKKLHE